MTTNTLISLAYYLSSLGFLVASVVTYRSARSCSQSGLKTVLNYLFIGTAIFFVITVFQQFVALQIIAIPDASADIWWHLMFYMAMISFYVGFKSLARLGSTDGGTSTISTATGKMWGITNIFLLIIIFVIATSADPVIQMYTSSRWADLGTHHIIAFILAGIVGAYLFSAKLFLGQIGRAIAGPMIIAVWAFAGQHLWEILVESLKVVVVTSTVGEGVEKIFLIIAAASITIAALRLQSFAKAS